MKLATTSLAALAAFTIAAPVSAAVLFTDNFDNTSTPSQTPNYQTTNLGRQGGTLATLGYLVIGNVQIGNLTTYPANAPNSDVGDDMLAANSGRAYVNHDFSNQTLPLSISFRGLIDSAGNNLADWLSVTVANNTIPAVNAGTARSILFRANGGIQTFNLGSSTANLPANTAFAPGFDAWTDYQVVLSDTAGTGSAWGTGGSRADYYSNGSFIGTFTMSQLTADEGYIGFSSNRISGYDDLKIESIPEPSTALLGGLGLLALLRRRR